MRFRTALAATVALPCVVWSAAGSSTSVAAAPDPQAVASGVVLDSGDPVAGAVVVVWAQPDHEREERAQVGDSTSLYFVGGAITDATGAFAVDAEPPSLPGWVRSDRGGSTDFLVQLVAGDRAVSYSFSAKPKPSPAANATQAWTSAADDAVGQAARPFVLHVDLGARTAWNEADDPSRWLDDRGERLGERLSERRLRELVTVAVTPISEAQRAIADGVRRGLAGRPGATQLSRTALAAAAIPACIKVYVGDDLNHPEHFVDLNAMTGVPETVTESSSSAHTLGVGVYSSTGGWSQGGTQTISRTATVSASQKVNTAYSIYNRVNYRIWNYSCATRRREPWNFYDILTDDGGVIPYTGYPNCTPHSAGSHWDTGSTSNVTWSNGVDLGVVKLSAQSGYASSLNLHYDFNVAGQVCGNNTSGPLFSSKVSGWRN